MSMVFNMIGGAGNALNLNVVVSNTQPENPTAGTIWIKHSNFDIGKVYVQSHTPGGAAVNDIWLQTGFAKPSNITDPLGHYLSLSPNVELYIGMCHLYLSTGSRNRWTYIDAEIYVNDSKGWVNIVEQHVGTDGIFENIVTAHRASSSSSTLYSVDAVDDYSRGRCRIQYNTNTSTYLLFHITEPINAVSALGVYFNGSVDGSGENHPDFYLCAYKKKPTTRSEYLISNSNCIKYKLVRNNEYPSNTKTILDMESISDNFYIGGYALFPANSETLTIDLKDIVTLD